MHCYYFGPVEHPTALAKVTRKKMRHGPDDSDSDYDEATEDEHRETPAPPCAMIVVSDKEDGPNDSGEEDSENDDTDKEKAVASARSPAPARCPLEQAQNGSCLLCSRPTPSCLVARWPTMCQIMRVLLYCLHRTHPAIKLFSLRKHIFPAARFHARTLNVRPRLLGDAVKGRRGVERTSLEKCVCDALSHGRSHFVSGRVRRQRIGFWGLIQPRLMPDPWPGRFKEELDPTLAPVTTRSCKRLKSEPLDRSDLLHVKGSDGLSLSPGMAAMDAVVVVQRLEDIHRLLRQALLSASVTEEASEHEDSLLGALFHLESLRQYVTGTSDASNQ